MTINHINLVVSNVAAARNLFETNFGFTCTLNKGDNVIAVLENQEHFTLVLMTDKGDMKYPANFHIGFLMQTTQEVSDTYQLLKKNGIPVERAPGKVRNSFAFYFRFDTFMIEVGTA